MYRLKDVYTYVTNQLLSSKNLLTSQIEVEIILSKALRMERLLLYTEPDIQIDTQQLDNLNFYLSERLKGKPLAYILNEREFYGITFYVDNNVFIPRQETEMLVEKTIELIKKCNFKTCADIGTGCGNIAISIVKNLQSNIKMYATDISVSALEIAKKNAKSLGVDDKINFILSDKLEYFIQNSIKVDVLVSNPPYVTEQEYKNLQVEIYFEPKQALVAASGGLEFYEHFADYGYDVVNTGGYILVEVNHNLVAQIVQIFDKREYEIVELINDYQGLPRVLVVKV